MRMVDATVRWYVGVGFTLVTMCGSAGQPLVQDGGPAGEYFSVQLVPEYTVVEPGQTFRVGLHATMTENWVWYGPAPGGPVVPAEIEVRGEGVTLQEVLWPKDKPKQEDLGEGLVSIFGYTKQATVYLRLRVDDDVQPGPLRIDILPKGQVCGDSCIDIQPMFGEPWVVPLTVELADEPAGNPAWPEIADGLGGAMTVEQLRAARARGEGENSGGTIDVTGGAAARGFWATLGIALLAGLMLNIMPCVLPGIPIRILSLVEMAGQSRRRFVTMGLAFAGGMMVFFVGVAVLNIALKLTVGRGFGLSEALNNETFVIAMAMIFLALAANLLGVFNVVVPGKVAALDSEVNTGRAGHLKSVGMGLMMSILATPCSFGFLAAALTYAQAAALWQGTAVLLAVGLGFSAPHVLLAAFPKLVDRLPRPGKWMELFKQSAGFVLLLVVVWLVALLRGGGESRPYWVMAWGVLLVMGLWMWANWVRYDAPLGRKLVVRGVAVAMVAVTGWFMLPAGEPPLVTPDRFDAAAIRAEQQSGRVVVVKFTSNSCTKCIQQEAFVYDTPQTARLFEEYEVAYFKGNLSADEKVGRWMMDHVGSTAVPLTLAYPAGGGEPEAAIDLDIPKLRAMVERAAE